MNPIERAADLRAEGKTLRQIGGALGLSHERIRQLLYFPPRVRHCRCGCGAVMGYMQQYVAGHQSHLKTRVCKCGCGTPVPRYQQYTEGHRPAEKGRVCRCGCGGKVERYRQYLDGHRHGERAAALATSPASEHRDDRTPSDRSSSA